jgi:hypothetical protein
VNKDIIFYKQSLNSFVGKCNTIDNILFIFQSIMLILSWFLDDHYSYLLQISSFIAIFSIIIMHKVDKELIKAIICNDDKSKKLDNISKYFDYVNIILFVINSLLFIFIK